MVSGARPWRLGVCAGLALLVTACTAAPPPRPPAPPSLPVATATGVQSPADATGAPEIMAEVEPGSIATGTSLPAATPVPPPTFTSAPSATPTSASTATPTAVPPTSTPTALPTSTPVLQLAAPSAPDRILPAATGTPTRTFSAQPNPLQIAVMRQQDYPGSAITFEQTLQPGANYSRYIVSYRSDGFKIYALMTIPNGQKPAAGWPVIVFNHGYIPPAQYRTTERYVAYVDAIARSGYIVFKSDYRGHGGSEGSSAAGGYGSPAYTVDVLNAVASLKVYKDADPHRIGMWGHSMGGQITLRAMVVDHYIKAGVIWGGVVAPYPDMMYHWTRRVPAPVVPYSARRWRQDLINEYGTPAQNPDFWASISPNAFLKDLSGPLQLHHSVTDEEVPVAFSQTLLDEAKAAGDNVELYTYPGDNHNINGNFNTAMARSIAWFDKYVKGAGG